MSGAERTRTCRAGVRLAHVGVGAVWLVVCSVVALGATDATVAQEAKAGARPLAPRILTTIPAEPQANETLSVHDVIELRDAKLKWSPNFTPESRTLFEMAKDVNFRRPVWCLEFSFKPLRMVTVDVPQPSGKMRQKLIWYLVYRVRNTGQVLTPTKKADGSYELSASPQEIRFVPAFVLESYEFQKAYLDRLVPSALETIRQREDPKRRFLTTIEMAATPIPVSGEDQDGGVWGVATWEGVDPRIDFFSIYVQGLTNAYRWTDPEGGRQPNDPPGKGRRFTRKTLKLNFWRPGDTIAENEEEIRFGTPVGREKLYGVEPGVDSIWVYR